MTTSNSAPGWRERHRYDLVGILALLALLVPTVAQAAMTWTNFQASGITETGVGSLSADISSTSSLTFPMAFEYGLDTSYGTSLSAGNVTPFFSGTKTSAAITGLTCGTTYHWRTNITGAGTSADQTFTTLPCAQAIPTLSEWGMITMFVLLGGAMVWMQRRQARGV